MKLYKEQEKKQFWWKTQSQQETSYMTAWLKHDPPVHSSTSKVLTSYLVSWMHSHDCSWHVILCTTVAVYILPANVGFYNILIPHVQFPCATSNLTVVNPLAGPPSKQKPRKIPTPTHLGLSTTGITNTTVQASQPASQHHIQLTPLLVPPPLYHPFHLIALPLTP